MAGIAAPRSARSLSFPLLAAVLWMAAASAAAQHISVGIDAGVPLTGGFSDVTGSSAILAGAAQATFSTRTYSDTNNYLLGPMIEVRLPLNLAIEFDALYRPLNLSATSQASMGATVRSSQDYYSWEFPLLGKYRLPLLPVVKPFVEAGPSFRKTNSSIGWLSGKGFTIGGGIEVKILRLRIAPELRYTHWGSDSQESGLLLTPGSGNPAITFISPPPSGQNQGEFLVGFSF